ncbi:lipoprotein NlpI [Shewanella acanthi]|uniref:lipoprotein NlpI n=1 Tax=Shewanella acanthi TaxID=2864212 RepID=UPI001C65845F|nr:lipoprotein NlpI [Shewanella acanthi]QYJ79679.1 lipoprotein NlpI [Shewanella acanthi]
MSLKIRTAVVAVLAGASLMLAGCATTGSPLDNRNDVEGKLVIAPVMPDYKVEVTLAKLNEILSAVELTNEQRARFHYDRGVIYDSVGLRLMARIDFMQALKLQPDLADAYNFLGIYFTQEGEYDSAYEAFDGVLELSPNYDYAYLNRGIALYYGGRTDLAVKDMQAFYAGDNKDGYRALWLYLIQAKDNAEEAKSQLTLHHKTLEADAWSTVIVDYYLGTKSRDDVFAAAKLGLTHPKEYAERLCEAYFYLGKMAVTNKQFQDAANYFRLALATNIYDFVEHRYARVELAKVKDLIEQSQVAKSSN